MTVHFVYIVLKMHFCVMNRLRILYFFYIAQLAKNRLGTERFRSLRIFFHDHNMNN